jgi:outer membrane protein
MIFFLFLGAALGDTVTLDDVLGMAREHNVEIQVADLEVTASQARANQIRSYYLPTITATGAALWWNEKLEAELFEGDPCADLDATLKPFCDDMVGSMLDEPMLLREKATQQLEFKAVQPLTGLYGVYEGHRATRALMRSAKWDRHFQQARVEIDVVQTYLEALKTQELVGVAEQGIGTLEAHHLRATAFWEEGLVGRNEILQIEVALADTRLNAQRAKVGVKLLQRKLSFLAGSETVLQPAPLSLETLPQVDVNEDVALERALLHPAVKSLEEKSVAARAGRNRANADRIPQVVGMATWTRNWGVGSFAAAEEMYVGLGLQWEMWAWGRRHYAARESGARARQAQVGLIGRQAGAELEVRAALSELDLTRNAWMAAGTTVGQAEENLRIVTALFNGHKAPATDILEAEALLSKARSDRIGATYDALVAIALVQSLVALPVAPLEGLSLIAGIEE